MWVGWTLTEHQRSATVEQLSPDAPVATWTAQLNAAFDLGLMRSLAPDSSGGFTTQK
jgi:hypothetical protein